MSTPKIMLAIISLTLAFPASATEIIQVEPKADAPERISFLTTFGEEECPEAVGDEIVVCATAPEGDRYRIPKKLREKDEVDLAGGSWTSAVESLDEAARSERPNSCSAVGTNGFTGCTQAILRQWFAERRAKEASKTGD